MDAALEEWLRKRAAEDDRLYDQFAAPLEPTHGGQYAAIGKTGEHIVGADNIVVLDEALVKFGPGEFAFRKIGQRPLGRWG
jgi:hypothetical protein